MTFGKNGNDSDEHAFSGSTTTNTTSFTGPVSIGVQASGSGDVYVETLTQAVRMAADRDEFLKALRAFRQEVEALPQRGVSENITTDVVVELEAVEREAQKATPERDRVTRRLENAKTVLTAAAGAAGAATAASDAIGKLMPTIETAMHTATRLFS